MTTQILRNRDIIRHGEGKTVVMTVRTRADAKVAKVIKGTILRTSGAGGSPVVHFDDTRPLEPLNTLHLQMNSAYDYTAEVQPNNTKTSMSRINVPTAPGSISDENVQDDKVYVGSAIATPALIGKTVTIDHRPYKTFGTIVHIVAHDRGCTIWFTGGASVMDIDFSKSPGARITVYEEN